MGHDVLVSDASALAGYPVSPPPLPGAAVFEQFWADVTFIHWPLDPGSIAHLFPAGTRPDVFSDGMTYVGLVPFAMRHTGFGLLSAVPKIPYFGRFLETNVRLYSVDDTGRHGVLFRSLETTRLAVVPLIRGTLGVPYMWAKMRLDTVGDRVTYQSVRRWPRPGLRSRVTVSVGDEVEPTPLEIWCTARWGAHTQRAGRTLWVPNEHEPWQLHVAEIVELSDDLVTAAEAVPAGEPLRALFSPGVHARFGRPVALR
jgi:uncharacterized protein